MNKHSLFVVGKPEPHPRPRFGQGHFYTPATVWARIVFNHASLRRPKPPFTGPVRCDLKFFFKQPKTVPKSAVWMDRRPDRDNCDKAVLDALTAAGWWKDDSQVVAGDILKLWSGDGMESGVLIQVYELKQPLTEKK